MKGNWRSRWRQASRDTCCCKGGRETESARDVDTGSKMQLKRDWYRVRASERERACVRGEAGEADVGHGVQGSVPCAALKKPGAHGLHRHISVSKE